MFLRRLPLKSRPVLFFKFRFLKRCKHDEITSTFAKEFKDQIANVNLGENLSFGKRLPKNSVKTEEFSMKKLNEDKLGLLSCILRRDLTMFEYYYNKNMHILFKPAFIYYISMLNGVSSKFKSCKTIERMWTLTLMHKWAESDFSTPCPVSDVQAYFDDFTLYHDLLPVFSKSMTKIIKKFDIHMPNNDLRIMQFENIPINARTIYFDDRTEENLVFDNKRKEKTNPGLEYICNSIRTKRVKLSSVKSLNMYEAPMTTDEMMNNLIIKWTDDLNNFLLSYISCSKSDITRCSSSYIRSGFSENDIPILTDVMLQNVLAYSFKMSHISLSFLLELIGNVMVKQFRDKVASTVGIERYLSHVTNMYHENLDKKPSKMFHREFWLCLSREEYLIKPHLMQYLLTHQIKAKIGEPIIKFLIYRLTDTQGSKVFYPVLAKSGSNAETVLYEPNEFVKKVFEFSSLKNDHMSDQQLPYSAPCMPYINFIYGNSVTSVAGCVKGIVSFDVREYLTSKFEDGSMAITLDTVSELGSVGWRVNPKMLDVFYKMLNSRKKFNDLKLPTTSKKLTLKDCFNLIFKDFSTNHRKLPNEYMKALRYLEECRKDYQQWINTLMLLKVSETYKDIEFFMPHFCDFRGRVYPKSLYLNYHNRDSTRGLLLFSKKKKLGDSGLYWLKVHLATFCSGCQGMSFEQKINFVNENMDSILKSATDPLECEWWTEQKKPWQLLASCMELKAVLENPDYESGLPIHLDGTCNGLQHYAAIVGMRSGAKSVNLIDSEFPEDVYNDIAKIVKNNVAKNPVMNHILYNGDIITRDLVKLPVMTFVYGVTKRGASDQIAKKLNVGLFPGEERITICNYLSSEVFNAMTELFGPIIDVQKWIINNVSYVCKKRHHPIWITPSNFIVNQHYHNMNVDCFAAQDYKDVDVQKNESASAPNFIHSLDASHMMLTCLDANRKGLTFASVHDSFWTHACDVNILNPIIRENFVKIHKQNLLKKFQDDLMGHAIKIDVTRELEAIPKRYDFDVEEVLKSRYFFS